MIISRAPFRVSFCGGGSDIPSFYEKYTGCVLSTTIRKYVYLTINKAFNKDSITLKYSETEVVNDPSQIKHRIFRQVLTDFKTKGVEITSMADIPAGTGLGSSSIPYRLIRSRKKPATSKSINSAIPLGNKTNSPLPSVDSVITNSNPMVSSRSNLSSWALRPEGTWRVP